MANLLPPGLSPSHKMNEPEIHDYKLPHSIGVKWKDLARALGYLENVIDAIEEEKFYCTKECCIKVLVLWLEEEGSDATAARLANALRSIGLKNLADILVCPSDPNQDNKFEKEIRKIKNQVVSLEAEGSRLKARIKYLEEEGSRLSGRNKELEGENQKLRARLEFEHRQEASEVSVMGSKSKEAEEQLSSARRKCQEKQEEEDYFPSDTDQANREHRIGVQLKNISEQLNTYVTSPLQAPVVRLDQLRLAVKLDLLIRLSENLQELYTEIQGMISEAAKCSEDLRRDYYDLAYHGLRAEHYDLVHRVEELKSAQEEMFEEERKEYERLQSYQKDRQRQVEALDKVWRRLFSPVDRLPKKRVSDPTGNKSRGSKKVMRNTDPGDRLKFKFKLPAREEMATGAEAPSTSNNHGKPDEESSANLVREIKSTVGTVIQSISRKKEGGEKQGSSTVPYTLMRNV